MSKCSQFNIKKAFLLSCQVEEGTTETASEIFSKYISRSFYILKGLSMGFKE
jgi:hypothetical protein